MSLELAWKVLHKQLRPTSGCSNLSGDFLMILVTFALTGSARADKVRDWLKCAVDLLDSAHAHKVREWLACAMHLLDAESAASICR